MEAKIKKRAFRCFNLLFLVLPLVIMINYPAKVIPDSLSITQMEWRDPFVTYFAQGCNTTFIISWDDARVPDYNLAPIDEKYGIIHTIMAPSYRSYPNRTAWRYTFLIDELFQGHDIQSHCGKHVHLSDYNSIEQESLVLWGKTGIEELFGFTPIVFAYPFGDLGGAIFVEEFFDLGRTIGFEGTSWPPSNWPKAGTTISSDGINDRNLGQIVTTMTNIYRTSSYDVFKGYGHTNYIGQTYGVTDFAKYEANIKQIAGWTDVWYTSWGELVSYTIEKNKIIIGDPVYSSDQIRFNISAESTLNTEIYKVPITVSIAIPRDWDNVFPTINDKYTSQFSRRYHYDHIELLLNVIPSHKNQTIKIWRDIPLVDQAPPEIANFSIKTRTMNESWDREPPQLFNFTFMRFDVTDAQTNVQKVNASVSLENGTVWYYSNVKNPIFWQNSTYGRVVWNSTKNNYNLQQINESEVLYAEIMAQDGFGNIRVSAFYPNGTKTGNDQIIIGNQTLLHFPDKNSNNTQQS
ncbi:MAG: hypothetical protein ACFFDT_18495, partial [Candidatus Hodarchaeota archaeon]